MPDPRTALALALSLVLIAPGVALAEEELLYYEDGGKLVFTNTPSRPDAKVLPGYHGTRLPAAATLPATPYDSYIERLAAENGLSPGLIKAVAWAESNFEPGAVSPKGAVGLMQLMPATAERYGVRDRTDPYESLRAGARHLRDLLDEFGGDLRLALAAYNAGSGAVRRHGGVPAYRETRDYVTKIEGRLGRARSRAAPGEAAVSEEPIELRRKPDGTIEFVN